MIYLITATPGSGKTLWAVNEIFKRVNEPESWNIFSNIDGLKLDTAQPLKESFNDYPARSLVVIDEAQKISHFSKKYKHPIKNENHPEVEFLQTHRHADHLDIIFITQAPRLLNADVLDMVGTHYHLHRPMGMKMATWWMWKYHQLNPNTKSAKADAEDSGTFTYPKNLFGMYKSSDGGTDSHGKIKIPMKIVQAVWMLVLVIGVTTWLYLKQKPDETVGLSEKQKTEQTTIKQTIPESAAEPLENLDIECRKGINVEKPECIQWFNDFESDRQNQSVSDSRSVESDLFDYDSSNPYSFNPKVKLKVVDFPRLSGCAINLQGQYIGFDQQGNVMPSIKQSDCKKWINGERLFDYTATRSQSEQSVSQQIEKQSYDVELAAKYEQAREEGLL